MNDTPPTRLSLLMRLRNPADERAWRDFTEIYGPLVRGVARRKGLQAADAADLEQEVFRAVASAIDRWNPDPARGSFRAWLYRISRNILVDFLGRRARHPQGSGDTAMHELLQDQPARADEDSRLFDEEYKRRVFVWASEQVQTEFSNATWRAFWMTGVEGASARAAASSLGITPGAVYRCKSRVMARLRQKIEEVTGEP